MCSDLDVVALMKVRVAADSLFTGATVLCKLLVQYILQKFQYETLICRDNYNKNVIMENISMIFNIQLLLSFPF